MNRDYGNVIFFSDSRLFFSGYFYFLDGGLDLDLAGRILYLRHISGNPGTERSTGRVSTGVGRIYLEEITAVPGGDITPGTAGNLRQFDIRRLVSAITESPDNDFRIRFQRDGAVRPEAEIGP